MNKSTNRLGSNSKYRNYDSNFDSENNSGKKGERYTVKKILEENNSKAARDFK